MVEQDKRSYFVRLAFLGSPDVSVDIPVNEPITFEESELRFTKLKSVARKHKKNVSMRLFVRDDDKLEKEVGYWDSQMDQIN